ncbi:MAG: hypothetical protein E6Y08_11240 [Paenibacillus sp.]|uniref:hypothetical protein n=1 Tax=Paenibacillus sp. TaxID=58172 RepID=UPI00290B7155|nr:hypothetical protein [Paenibacillus sp.]MDU4696382.1 hypothetical protein [Paenibacillus sp.]
MINAEQWLRSTYEIVQPEWDDKDTIYWGNGIYTTISNFLLMFGEVIQLALDDNQDVKEAIRNSDPQNVKGFNDIL